MRISLDILSWSEDGPPEGGALVGYGVEMVEYHLINLLVHLLGGFQLMHTYNIHVCP